MDFIYDIYSCHTYVYICPFDGIIKSKECPSFRVIYITHVIQAPYRIFARPRWKMPTDFFLLPEW